MPAQSEIVKSFIQKLNDNKDDSSAVSAIVVLMEFLLKCEASTFMETKHQLNCKAEELIGYASNQHLSTASGCQLFLTFVSDFDKDHLSVELTYMVGHEKMIFLQDVNDWKNEIIERGKTFVENVKSSRQKAVQVGERFITDGATILTHGYSRTVKTLLLKAAQKKKFKVIVTEGRPECLGYRYAEELSLHEIPVTIILDSAVGRIMERVDFVIVGAENVTENGGVINKLGTYPLALTAVAAHKPVYGIVESFKFARLYPLRQDDLPPSQDETVNFSSVPPNKNTATKDLVKFFNPLFDFTPPSYIQLLFTDLGVLTPSAVSDELIKLCPN